VAGKGGLFGEGGGLLNVKFDAAAPPQKWATYCHFEGIFEFFSKKTHEVTFN
jgi:hypothetical protein